MATMAEGFQASSMKHWTRWGKNSLIKVMNEESVRRTQKGNLDNVTVRGYFGQAKYIYGMRPFQIERALGLPPFSLTKGAYIYQLDRFPTFAEIDFRYSLAWPDGKVPTPAEYMALIARRDSALAGMTSEPSLYPPGGVHIPQWTLIKGHPGIGAKLLQLVKAEDKFARDKLYMPHNRNIDWGSVL